MIRKCVESGWTSVMIDASDQPFDRNLLLSRQVVEMASAKNVGVEAEIGQILGVEDDMVVRGYVPSSHLGLFGLLIFHRIAMEFVLVY